jgi:hypothetical protein
MVGSLSWQIGIWLFSFGGFRAALFRTAVELLRFYNNGETAVRRLRILASCACTLGFKCLIVATLCTLIRRSGSFVPVEPEIR